MIHIERPAPNTLCLFGDLDLASYELLRTELGKTSGPVTLEVSGITFVDSTGLRVILQRLHDGPITLVSPSEQVRRLLDLCHLEDLNGLTVENRQS
jgi:anti-anti-sigma factor